ELQAEVGFVQGFHVASVSQDDPRQQGESEWIHTCGGLLRLRRSILDVAVIRAAWLCDFVPGKFQEAGAGTPSQERIAIRMASLSPPVDEEIEARSQLTRVEIAGRIEIGRKQPNRTPL